ncbi:MAG: S9 family peptidase [Anaerolineae bacterium]|nr:S9 family peptidase [Anaerolineae bacterium]
MSEEKRTVEAADLFRLQFTTGGQLSPDGSYAAYTVTHVDAEKETEYSAIWLMNLDSGDTRQFTSGTARDADPQWSPDGKHIAFLSTRGEKPQIYVIPVDGGEARAVTKLKQGTGGGIAWSPDGKQIAFTAPTVEEPRDMAKPYRVTRHVYRFNDMEYLDDVVQSLYVVDVESGEARRLTDDRLLNTTPQWSPDGTEILLISSMYPDTHKTFYGRLRVINVESGEIRTLTDEWGQVTAAGWLPDGKRIAFDGVPHGKIIGSKTDIWVMDSAGGVPECRSAGLEVGVGGGLQADMPVMGYSQKLLITSDGKYAVLGVQAGGDVNVYQVALEGEESWAPLLTGERTVMPQSLRAGKLLYLVSEINHPIDLYVANADGSGERQLTHLNDDWLAGVKLPSVEHLLFSGSDGAQVEGWIALPASDESAGEAPFPTVLYIHGGPHSAFGNTFHFDTQMLCGAGYAVLLVNHRASTGYGDEFSTAIKGDWGNLDYTDLMAGVDYAIAQGYTDGDKLGVCGLSGGGNLSCWIVGKTDRFKAAVPENPVTNWVSMYGVSDISAWFAVEELGGAPHEIPDVYARCSPITFAHNCKTPTLMLQGEHDWRCPPEQSEQFYTTLKANGCIVEMVRFPTASHAASIFGAPAVRTAQNDALLGWMNQYVLGKTDQTRVQIVEQAVEQA